ncbi:MAG: hypothetical protein QM610_08410 [Chitinophagaceae bacterium]
MKTYYKLLSVSLIAMTSIISCRPTTSVPTPSAGSTLDVSQYVAIGNSITSGFADAALYMEGQEVSYPNLLAQQLKTIGGGDFVQPLTPANSVGIGSTGNAKLILSVVDGSLTPVYAAASGDSSIWTTSVASSGPFNNMGVPGAKAITTVYAGYGNPANGAGNYNPFFTRMTTDPVNASILSDAAAQQPTFFSMFIGNNDVLAYALAGGASDAITPTANFNASIDAIVSTMMVTATSGVVANIPDITNIPYFTTVPYNPVPLDESSATTLNTEIFTPLNTILTALGQSTRFQTLTTTSNPVLITDNSLTNMATAYTAALVASGIDATEATLLGLVFGQARHATASDLVLLSTSSVIGTAPSSAYAISPLNKYGVSFPLDDSMVLTATEVSAIKTATTAYNEKLQSVADSKGLAFVDVAAFMEEAQSGIEYNGRVISATFVTGGAFSLDGIHLTPLGNALLANEFIKSINSKYGSTIPQIDATRYSGVKFP